MKRKRLILGLSMALLMAFTTVSAQAQLEPLVFGMVGAGVGLAASGGNPAGAAIGGAIGVGTGILASAANAHAGYGYYGDDDYRPGYYHSSYYRRTYVQPAYVVNYYDHGPRHHYRSRYDHHDRDWARDYPHRHNDHHRHGGYRHDGHHRYYEARVHNW